MADFSNLVYPFLTYQRTRNPFSFEKIEEVERNVNTLWLSDSLVRQQLNLVDDTSQNVLLEQLDLSVRMYIENYLGVPILTRTFNTYYSSAGLNYQPVYLDLPYVNQATVTILSVMYWSNASPSVLVTLPTTSYSLDATGNRIIINSLPPDLSNIYANPFIAQWQIQASPLATYPDIQQAGLLLLTHFYNNRANSMLGDLRDIPFGFKALLQAYKPLVM